MDENSATPIEIWRDKIENILQSAQNHLEKGQSDNPDESCLMPHLEKMSLLKKHIKERMVDDPILHPLINKVSQTV